MFRLNFWSRPLLNNTSNHHSPGSCPGQSPTGATGLPPTGPIDYTAAAVAAATAGGGPGAGPYLPLSMAASPALMVLASNGQQEGTQALALHAARSARSASVHQQRADDIPSPDIIKEPHRSGSSSSTTGGPAGQHHHPHSAFGSTPSYPFYRHGASGTTAGGNPSAAADSTSSSSSSSSQHHHHNNSNNSSGHQHHQLPPLFSHLHQSLLRSHLDSAAVHAAAAHLQHQARLGAAALFGQRLASAAAAMAAAAAASHGGSAAVAAAGNGYRSAFVPASGRIKPSAATGSRNNFIAFQQQQQQHEQATASLMGGGTSASGRTRSYSGDGDRAMSDDEAACCGGGSDVIAQSPSAGSRGSSSRRHVMSCGRRTGGRGESSPAGGRGGVGGPEMVDDLDVQQQQRRAAVVAGSSCNSPGLSYDADSDALSDQMSSAGDRITPNMDASASNFKGGQRWSVTSDGGGDIRCPVCRQSLQLEDIESHLIQEFTELQQLYNSTVHLDPTMSTISSEAMADIIHSRNAARDTTSKSRYDTFIRIRNNRETRLAKIRNRRKRLHDEMLMGQQQQHRAINGHIRDSATNAIYSQSRESNMDEDTMIDVIGFEDHEKENDWSGRNKPQTSTLNNNNTECCGEVMVRKLMEDKSTRTDDIPAMDRSPSAPTEADSEHTRGIVCSVCLHPFVDPLISVQCWHVHCELCWLNALSKQSTCPQCDVTISSSNLQRIHI